MRVLIPNPLRSYTANATAVDALGKTLGDLTRDLDRHYPGMRFRVVDEQGQIRPHIKFFVNGAPVRSLAEPLADAIVRVASDLPRAAELVKPHLGPAANPLSHLTWKQGDNANELQVDGLILGF